MVALSLCAICVLSDANALANSWNIDNELGYESLDLDLENSDSDEWNVDDECISLDDENIVIEECNDWLDEPLQDEEIVCEPETDASGLYSVSEFEKNDSNGTRSKQGECDADKETNWENDDIILNVDSETVETAPTYSDSFDVDSWFDPSETVETAPTYSDSLDVDSWFDPSESVDNFEADSFDVDFGVESELADLSDTDKDVFKKTSIEDVKANFEKNLDVDSEKNSMDDTIVDMKVSVLGLNENSEEEPSVDDLPEYCAEENEVDVVSSDSIANEPRKITYNEGKNPRYGAQIIESTNQDSVAGLNDQIWIIMTSATGYFCQVLDNNVWRSASIDEFYAGDSSSRPTIFWAHGFKTDINSAANSAYALRSTINQARLSTGNNKPYRLVVWKWASERSRPRICVDAKMKALLADSEGVAMGKFVERMNLSNKISFVGFSFGARVVGSALQYLATKSEISQSLRSGRISLVLMSAACELGAFNYSYAQGATLPTYVLNLYNPADQALRYYPMISETSSQAQGVAPVAESTFPNAIGKTFNCNVNLGMGNKHSFTTEIQLVPYNILLDSIF